MKREKAVLSADIMNDPNVQQAIKQVLAQKKPEDTAETKKFEPAPAAKGKKVNENPESVPKSKGMTEADVPNLPVVNDDDLSMYTEKTREKIIRNRKKAWEKIKRAASQKENKKIAHSVLDTYPVRDYRFGKSGGYFILDDGSVFDFLHVTGQSYLHEIGRASCRERV